MALMAGAAGGSRHMRPAMRATLMLETEVSAPIESAGIRDLSSFERTVVTDGAPGPKTCRWRGSGGGRDEKSPAVAKRLRRIVIRRGANHLLTDAGQ